MSWSARLTELGIEFPGATKPLAAYVPAVRTGDLVYTSGQLPMVSGELMVTGKVGGDVTPEVGKTLARVCALNALAAVDALVGIDSVVRVVKVVGYVASAAGFGTAITMRPHFRRIVGVTPQSYRNTYGLSTTAAAT